MRKQLLLSIFALCTIISAHNSLGMDSRWMKNNLIGPDDESQLDEMCDYCCIGWTGVLASYFLKIPAESALLAGELANTFRYYVQEMFELDKVQLPFGLKLNANLSRKKAVQAAVDLGVFEVSKLACTAVGLPSAIKFAIGQIPIARRAIKQVMQIQQIEQRDARD